MNQIRKFVDGMGVARVRLLSLLLLAAAFFSTASAQTGDLDVSGAQGTVTALLATGAAITIALVVFKLAKRAANKV